MLAIVSLAGARVAMAAGGPAPLPASDYGVRAACPAPTAGHAQCLAFQLLPKTAEARAHKHPLGFRRSRAITPASAGREAAAGAFGLRPGDLHTAYGLPTEAPSTQTIALVDAYNDPTAEADLQVYDEAFALPPCTAADGCLAKVNENGQSAPVELPFPKSDEELRQYEEHGDESQAELAQEARGWNGEISLDIEIAHAICQNCHILLLEASSSGDADLDAAEQTAERLGASEISNSWGGPEVGETISRDRTSPFNDPGVVITAATGDYGYLNWRLINGERSAPEREQLKHADYPASSPHVVAVGGTRLSLGEHSEWAGETVWNDRLGATGGGCSTVFAAPAWQQALPDYSQVGCNGDRSSVDISADADPYTGAAIYDSATLSSEDVYAGAPHWVTYGGTSLAAPQIAGAFALAGGSDGVEYPAQTLYQRAAGDPGALHDITSGSSGRCESFATDGLPTCTSQQEAEASGCAVGRLCVAAEGYDGPSGLGTPDGISAFGTPRAPSTAPAPPAEQRNPTTTTTPRQTTVSAAPVPVLSALALVRDALLALARTRTRVSVTTVAFSFDLSASARVRVSLAKRVLTHRHGRWQTLPDSITISAASGRDRARLTARGRLARGLYLLTLTPAGGGGRSITLSVG